MDVVGIGVPYYDMVINVKEMPKMDEAMEANEAFYQGGGKVATAMATVARLGKTAGILAKVGSNHRGGFVVEDLEYNGVDTSAILVDREHTKSPFCLSLSEEKYKTRMFIGKKGTAASLFPEELNFEYIKKAKYLHIENGDDASAVAVKFAKKHGITTVIDADSYHENIERIISYIDVFIASEFFYEGMFGDTDYEEGCKRLLELGVSTAIITLGKAGCVGMTKEDGFFTHESFLVEVKDTTGAGDVFHGAYIVGMLEHMNVKECVRFASAVSAIKCTFIGGRTGIPNRQTVQQFMETGVIDQTEGGKRLEYYRNNL